MRLRLASQTRSPINARLAVQANLANARTHCRPGSWMQVNPGVDIRRHVDHGVVQRKDHPDVFAVICAFIEIILPRYADPAILGAAPEALMGTDDCCQGVIEGTRGSDRLADGLQGNERTGRCFRIIFQQEITEAHKLHVIGPVRLSWTDIRAEVPKETPAMG